MYGNWNYAYGDGYGHGGYGNYGYNNWGWGYGWGVWDKNTRVVGTDDDCGVCEGGKLGCSPWTTYHNNNLLGSWVRPVMFTKVVRRCINGEEVDILVSDREFFDRLRFDCTRCREFYAVIATCIEFGDMRPVFIADKKGFECGRLLPLESKKNGFIIHADQIQPFADHGCFRLRLTACFDPRNEHVTIANYFRKHSKCDCFDGYKCGCKDGVDGFDGMEDGYLAPAEVV